VVQIYVRDNVERKQETRQLEDLNNRLTQHYPAYYMDTYQLNQ